MAKQLIERRPTPKEIQEKRKVRQMQKPKAPKIFVAAEKAGVHYWAGLIFWKMRNALPDFGLSLEEHEVEAFNQSLSYAGQTPELKVASGQRFISVRLADAKTGDPVKAFENNEGDFNAQQAARELQMAKDRTPQLVLAALSELSAGITSDATIKALCNAASLMARA